MFKDRDVVIMGADWTKPDERILPTIKKFNSAAIPANALYVPDGDPQVTSEAITANYLKEFIKKHLP